MRYIGGFVALIGVYALLLAIGGNALMCFVSIALFIVGALLFAAAQRRDNAETEERRHREILDAVKRGEK